MEGNIESLRTIPVFTSISEETLRSLALLLKENKYLKGEYIIREGEQADSMYILHSGEVEVRKVIDSKTGKYKILAILEEGDVFGEMAVFGEKFRSADVVARKDCSLWKIDCSDLFDVINTDPKSGIRLLEVIIAILISRIKSLNRELTTLYELGRLIPQAEDINALTGMVFEQLMNDIEPAKAGFIAIWNKYNEEFDIYQSANIKKVHHIEKSDPVAVWILENKSSLLIKDTGIEKRFKDRFYSGRSMIASPLIYNGEITGFILLSNPSRKNAFTYSHMVLLSTACNQVTARLKEIERRGEEKLRERLGEGKLMVSLYPTVGP
ncbi:MAG: cyclic nucleotide-binding domain-containing protein [Nitrospirota bacterium]